MGDCVLTLQLKFAEASTTADTQRPTKGPKAIVETHAATPTP